MDVREKLVELQLQADIADNVSENTTQHREFTADFMMANGVTVQEWISVKDRLPDWRDGKVLVFTKYGFSICEKTVNNRWKGQHANWITHWAYLPQPPKGE